MDFWKKPSPAEGPLRPQSEASGVRPKRPAKELLEGLSRAADKYGFWLIKKRRWVKWLVVGIASCAAAVAVAIIGIMAAIWIVLHVHGTLKDSKGSPLDLSKLGRKDYKKESVVRARNGQIIWRYFDEVRDPIKLKTIQPLLAKGFLAAEDQRFYSHGGVDYRAMTRAVFINALHKAGLHYGQRSGASTVTQQLARRLYDNEVDSFRTLEQSYSRKILEGRLAIELEKRYTKDQILEGFLNLVWLGDGAYGVAEAAHREFGKDIRKTDLTDREIAIIVARNKSAEKYSPTFHAPAKPKRKSGMTNAEFQKLEDEYQAKLLEEMHRLTVARDRANYVLDRMLEDGHITQQRHDQAVFGEKDPPNLALLHITPFKNSVFGHAARMVKELLFMQGYKDDDILFRAGLQITTSIDPVIQGILAEELERQYEELNREITTKEKIEGTALVIDNRTGELLGAVGSHDFEETQFNRIFSLRSPGSAFKPITVAAAFEQGWNIDSKVCNCSFSLPDKIDIHGRVLKRWAPHNFQERNPFPSGYNDLGPTLFRSVNLGILDLARHIGIKSVIDMAHRMGVWGYRNEAQDPDGTTWFKKSGVPDKQKGLEPYLPTAIGGSGVSLLELATAYSEFARGGTYIRPTIITEITDSDGKVLYKAPAPKEVRVFSEETANKMTKVLRTVTKIGTLKISGRGLKQEMAAKTGTSNGPEDLSVMSYNPDLTIAIRFGYDQPKTIAVPEYMKRVSHDPTLHLSAGWTVGPVWQRIVNRIYEHRQKVSFSQEIEEGTQDMVVKYGRYQ